MPIDVVERQRSQITHGWRFSTAEEVFAWYETTIKAIREVPEKDRDGLAYLLEKQFDTHMRKLSSLQ